MSFDYKPPKKKKSKILNAIKVASDYLPIYTPFGPIPKKVIDIGIKKVKKAHMDYKKSKVGQTKGAAGGPIPTGKKRSRLIIGTTGTEGGAAGGPKPKKRRTWKHLPKLYPKPMPFKTKD